MDDKTHQDLVDAFATVADKKGLTLQEAFVEAVDLWLESKRRES